MSDPCADDTLRMTRIAAHDPLHSIGEPSGRVHIYSPAFLTFPQPLVFPHCLYDSYHDHDEFPKPLTTLTRARRVNDPHASR